MTPLVRNAACACGQLRVAAESEPERLSICHCQDCQRRTGSVFGAQARFPRERITVDGESRVWTRTGDGGTEARFHFCPTCGSTVFWEWGPGLVYVAVGAFADPGFPPPQHSVWEERRHAWVIPPPDAERSD